MITLRAGEEGLIMRKLQPETIEEVCRQKRHFMNVLKWARRMKNKKAIELYSRLVNNCDLKARVLRTAMWLIVSAVIFVSGCGAMEGLRQDIHQWTDSPAHHR